MGVLVYETATGRVIKLVTGANSHDQALNAGESTLLFDGTPDGYVDISTQTLVPFPLRPSVYHTWDWPTKSWLPDLPAATTARKAEIDVERDRRINLPLAYDGKTLDADARARENLKSKLEEIQSREALDQPMPVELLVWRDADNVTRSWSAQEAYKAWLEGLTIAMSERGTLIYAAAWQHKANVDALADIDAVLAYDITQGWP